MALLSDLVKHIVACVDVDLELQSQISCLYNDTTRSMLFTVTSYKQAPDGHAILPTATIADAYLLAAYEYIGSCSRAVEQICCTW